MLHVCVSATLYRPLDENYAPEEDVSVEKLERELKEQVRSSSQLIYVIYLLLMLIFIMYMQIITYVIIIYFPYKKLQTS